MAAQIGLNSKLYRGDAGSTAATEMTNLIDVSNPDERGEADISTRGGNVEQVAVTTRKMSIEFKMLWDEVDADFAAILAAYLAQDAIALKCISKASGKGVDGDFYIMKLTKSESLKDGITADVVAKPTYITRYPVDV